MSKPTVHTADWIPTQVSHNAIAYTCKEFNQVIIIRTNPAQVLGRITWTATISDTPVHNVTDDKISVNWFNKADLMDAIQKRLDQQSTRQAVKQNHNNTNSKDFSR